MSQIAWLVPLFPFLAFGAITFFTNRDHRVSAYTAIGGMVLALLVAYGVFFESLSIGAKLGVDWLHFTPVTWFNFGSGQFTMGWMIDPLVAVMLFMVTTTCLLIFIYSVGYMKEKVGEEHGHAIIADDPRYSRFFAYISLFAAAMLALVISSNLLMFFIAWEVMGFCSYALIGFWDVRLPTEHHIDEAQVLRARAASLKAFLTTRVGDTLFMAGMIFLFILTGDLDFKTIFAPETLNHLASAQMLPGVPWITVIALLILAGTVGKSAQFPLHIWLPDAMEGPTPVSALIHAATMVAAGVYLIARTYPLFVAAGPVALTAVAIVGAFTALFAATLGLAQDDIKRVLAFSTISQLGYMIAALGIGAFVAGSFHLITHAFFKALLFLAAGSVIHGIGTNDMMLMGGLRKKMPITSATFIIGALALMGIFPFAGFWSKDEILGDALRNGLSGTTEGILPLIVWLMLAAAAFLTALYTSRQIFLSFFGAPRDEHLHEHAHESPPVMWVPLAILAFFATVIGFWNIPGVDTFFGFVGAGGVYGVEGKIGEEIMRAPALDTMTIISAVVSLGIALLGFALGWLLYGRKPLKAGDADPLSKLGFIWTALRNKYWLDELYGYRINPDGSGVTGLLLRAVIWFAGVCFAFDRNVLDRIVNGAGALGRLVSFVSSLFDRYVVDTAVNGAGYLAEGASGALRLIQTGRVQNYLLLALLGAAIFALIFVARSFM